MAEKANAPQLGISMRLIKQTYAGGQPDTLFTQAAHGSLRANKWDANPPESIEWIRALEADQCYLRKRIKEAQLTARDPKALPH